MDIGDWLRKLARNLYWTWHPELIDVFRDFDPALWRQVNHNPIAFLLELDEQRLRSKADELALEARINRAFHQMQDYLAGRETWGARHAGPLRARPVAYFSAEFGLHESLPIYSGGLGVLAGDHLKSASDLDVPLVGIGLFYAKGYFHQRLDEKGWQQEDYFASDVNKLPMEWATDAAGAPLRVEVAIDDSRIKAGVWTAQVGRSRLILLDTNVEGNSDADRALTAQLYGGDDSTRVRQEMVLGLGGMAALKALGICPGVLHLNEGHSVFATLALALELMERDGKGFHDVRETAAAMTVFTTHTPLPAGNERFDPALIEQLLGGTRRRLGLSRRDFLALGRADPDNDGEPFCMTILGLKMSRSRNGVSARHGQVSRTMWQGLWPTLTEDQVPIGHVTNGVHLASWLAIPMTPLYDYYLGPDWEERGHEPDTWQGIDKIDDVEFWEQHEILKARLVDYVDRCVRAQESRRTGKPPEAARLNPAALTIGFARRFAAYKRSDLLFADLDRLDRLVNHKDRPVQIIFAGKAHPRDEEGKRRVQRVFQVTRDKRFAGKVVFLESHDINVSRHLVQGVDVWLNTPRRPMEACGTSGQKVVLNGGLNLSVLDGWWAEAYDGTNGFAIGCGGEHADPARQDKLDMDTLYDVLEREVVPLFYDRDEHGVPRGWVQRQKSAIRSLPWRFSARRMVMDYTLSSYLPAAGGRTSSAASSRRGPV